MTFSVFQQFRRWTLRGALFGLFAVLASSSVRAEAEKILNVSNWSEYIAEKTVRKFEAESGIKVRYDNFDSNEALLAKMIAGRSGYDIVVPSADFGRIMIDGKLVRRLDKVALSNWANLDPDMLRLLAKLDPGNDYLVPWLGGSVTVAYNVDKVKAALGGTPIPANPFELLFNPVYAGKLAKCGISLLDMASDVFPSVLIYLGKNPYSANPADYAAAAAQLQKVRPFIGLFNSLEYISDMASGSLCVAMGYSGAFNSARAKSAEARNKVNIATPLPPGGMAFGFDTMLIPADAPHPQNALKWINFILRPDIAAEIANEVMCTSPNRAARKFIKADLLNDPMTFPPEDYLKNKQFFYELRSNETRRVMTRLFSKLKTGT
jgi:putrescine transport system substrate-binding protein